MWQITEYAYYDGRKLTLENLKDPKLSELLKEKLGIDAFADDNGLHVKVESSKEAEEVYVTIAKTLLRTHHLEKLGFRYYDVFDYSFLVYLKQYRDGIEGELKRNPLSREFDIATLPNESGFYYSTLYGIDNIHIPAMLVLSNLFADDVKEFVDAGFTIQDFLDLKELSRDKLKIERFGGDSLLETIERFERVSSVEDVMVKLISVRRALSNEVVISGKVEYSELQKVRKLGNGLAVYISRQIRRLLEIKESDLVSVRVVNKKICIERQMIELGDHRDKKG